jgi:hypothetical protein
MAFCILLLITIPVQELYIKWNLWPLAWILLNTNQFLSWCVTNAHDLSWIENHEKEIHKRNQLIQREIYLNNGIESLYKVTPISNNETDLLKAYEIELQQINQSFWQHQQEMQKLEEWKISGPWTREYAVFRGPGKLGWKASRRACKLGGGCCSRDCGCCERPQKTHRVKQGDDQIIIHCTIACGCCVRNRGFFRPDPNIKPWFKDSGNLPDMQQELATPIGDEQPADCNV